MIGIPGDCYETQSLSGGLTLIRDSLKRLRELAISVVYGGHDGVFGRDRMIEIIDAYLAGGKAGGDVSTWIEAHG